MQGHQLWIGITGDPSSLTISYSDVQGGESEVYVEVACTLNWLTGNIDSDPLFTSGPQGDYYLSQIAAGQGVDSPCVNTGDPATDPWGWSLMTTRTDEQADSGIVDMGYHYPLPCTDLDGDSYAIEGGLCGQIDCDDSNPDVNPGETEACDGIDNNCIDGIDEEPAASSSCNNGDFCDGLEYCASPSCQSGVDPCSDDGEFCNGTESCDEVDDQCLHSGDPCTDDEIPCTDDACNEITDTCDYVPSDPYCADSDECTSDYCSPSTGCNHIINKDTDDDQFIDENCLGGSDCDDSNPAINPGAEEICDNEIDDDCDGDIDDADSHCTAGYSSAANAEASVYGQGSVTASGVLNELSLLLIPLCTVILWRFVRRKG